MRSVRAQFDKTGLFVRYSEEDSGVAGGRSEEPEGSSDEGTAKIAPSLTSDHPPRSDQPSLDGAPSLASIQGLSEQADPGSGRTIPLACNPQPKR